MRYDIILTEEAVEDLKRLRAFDRLENDPRFLARIAQARASYQAGRGVRLEDVDFNALSPSDP
jgi:hypothetical protein